MSGIENLLQSLAPHWIVLFAVVASLLVNLLLLGLVLGRADRQAVRLAGRTRTETGRRLDEMERRLGRGEALYKLQLEEMRRALGRIELRQSRALPDWDEEQPQTARRRRNGIDKKHHVYTLARRGLDPARIAQRLNMYQGEAELVLGLRQFMASQTARPQHPVVH